VRTEGKKGGTYESGGRSGRYEAVPLPGPLADTYGAGDSFSAGLTYALGARMPIEEALAFAAAQGADAMTRRGAHGV
jgi:sugar/nucleoside kinase (ribokinase family)